MEKIVKKKIVVIGNGSVGKTCLLLTYTTNCFPQNSIPTVFDNYTVTKCMGDYLVNIDLWDTAGQDDYERLRPLSYPQTDVCVICFALNDFVSLEDVKLKWLPEIRHHCENVPMLLVGTKLDLREPQFVDSKSKFVSYQQGLEMSKSIGAVKYVECSSMTQKNVKEVFDEIVRTAINKHCQRHAASNCKVCMKKEGPEQKCCTLM